VWKRKKIFAVDLFVVLWILIFEKKRSREECLVKIPTLIEERTLNPKKNKKKNGGSLFKFAQRHFSTSNL
jgi:UDP-N-acetylenolpyruvoylglucosamine reductase